MPQTPETNQTCSECWNRALYAHGTAQVFLARSERYKRKLRWLAFVGIAGALLIGGIVTGFGVGAPYLSLFIAGAAIVTIGQLLFSLWSLVADWTGELTYSLESASENLSLSSAFRELAEQAQNPSSDLAVRFAELRSRDESRRVSDTKQGVTEKEKRYGLRAGLLHFQRQCVECKQVPISMKSTKCGVCGDF